MSRLTMAANEADKKEATPTVNNEKQEPMGRSRYNLGKANPLRDTALFMLFFAVLFYLVPDIDPENEGKEPEKDVEKNIMEKIADGVNDFQGALIETLKEHLFEEGRRAESCSVFIAESSIPGVGPGLFAGRNYTQGEQILVKNDVLPLHLGDGTAAESWLPTPVFLLKPNPALVNVEESWNSDDNTFTLRALKAIEMGSEFFVNYQDYHTRFSHIPTAEDYDLANTIRSDADVGARTMQMWNAKVNQRRIHTGSIYDAVRKSVTRINSKVGGLLPKDHLEAKRHEELGIMVASLKNRTMSWLQIRGSCMEEDIFEQASSLPVSFRAVTKGKVVTRVPLHVLRNPQTCSSSDCTSFASCVGVVSSQVILCPLILSNTFNQPASEQANVKLRWRDEAFGNLSADELLKLPVGALAVEVVALKNLAESEEVSRASTLQSS